MILGPGSNLTPDVDDVLDALVNAKVKAGHPPYRIPLPSCSDDEVQALAARCRQAGWAAGMIRHEGILHLTLSLPSKPGKAEREREEEERG